MYSISESCIRCFCKIIQDSIKNDNKAISPKVKIDDTAQNLS
ncbi:hypothetical protein [Helicobacter bilis]|nr:hypothetical protein [Helicobacter bilis]MDD7296471.1 hypothetical protein [Helicobacter bilis]MDY4399576.1 hypothetical protein [Helicobacter bilis]